jgi:hypothetical protein
LEVFTRFYGGPGAAQSENWAPCSARTQTNHGKPKRKFNMKHLAKNITVAAAFTLSAVGAHAAVIDQVKNKVTDIQNKTVTIKNKTSDIQNRVVEISSTVNAQVAETIDIRTALDPLFAMRARMQDFDPTKVLDVIDTEQLEAMLANAQERKQEVEDALNDPGLEDFRIDMMNMFDGLENLVLEGVPQAPSPLKTLIERAPPKILASIKLATGDSLTEIVDLVQEISEFHAEHEDEIALAGNLTVASYQFAKEQVCSSTKDAQLVELFRMEKMQRKTIPRLINRIAKVTYKIKGKLDKEFAVGIHGYFQTKVNPYPPIENAMLLLIRGLDWKAKKLGPQIYRREIMLLAKECS